jgi:tetratricopeptide (TPR) repeat protein
MDIKVNRIQHLVILLIAVLGFAPLAAAEEYKAGDFVFAKNPPASIKHNDKPIATANAEDVMRVSLVVGDRLWVQARDVLRGDLPSGALEGAGWVEASEVMSRESAIVEMRQLTNRNADKLTPDFLLILASAYRLSEDHRDHWNAAGILLQAINRWPTDGRLYLHRAFLWHRMKRIDSAIRDLKRLEQVDPTKKELTSDLVASWSTEDPAAAAIAVAAKPPEPAQTAPPPNVNFNKPGVGDLAFPGDPPLPLKVGDNVVGEVDAEHYLKVLKQNGDWLWVDRGELLNTQAPAIQGWVASQGVLNVDMALAKWSKGLDAPNSQVNPQLVLLAMGRICELTERGPYRRKAVEYYSQGIQRWPDEVDFYDRRSEAYVSLAEFDEAIADVEKMRQLRPDMKELIDLRITMIRTFADGWGKMSAEDRAAYVEGNIQSDSEPTSELGPTDASIPSVPTPVGPPILPTQPPSDSEVPSTVGPPILPGQAQSDAEVPIMFARNAPAQLKIGARPSADVEAHHYMFVLRENDDWLWVERHSLAIPDEPTPKGWIARSAVMDIDEQIALFRRVAQAHRRPEHYAIAAKVCELRDTNKQYLVQAISCYNDAIALAPQEADYYARRGICWNSLGDAEQGLRDVERAAALAPNDAAIQRLLADLLEVEKLEKSLAPNHTP